MVDSDIIDRINYINKTQAAHGIYGGVSNTGEALTPLDYNASLVDPSKLPENHPKYQAPGSPSNSYGMSLTPPNTRVKPKLVPGLEHMGPLGLDLGGIKGLEARQKWELNARESNRQDEELGIKKDMLKIAQVDLGIRLDDHSMKREEFSWKKMDRDQQQVMLANMQRASQTGGYEGVINYLKVADPNMAIDFHAKKLKLDENIMSTEVMKNTAKNDINKARVEAWGIGGKLGAALMAMPPDQRQKGYETMKPLLSEVWGAQNLPDKVEDAAPNFILSMYQATDANQLFKSQNETFKGQTRIAKLYQDDENYAKQGYAPNSPERVALQEGIMAERAKYTQATNELAHTTIKMANQDSNADKNIVQTKSILQKQLDSNQNTKDFNTMSDLYTKSQAQLDVLQKDPKNSSAQGILGTLIATAVQKGVLTDPDYARIAYSTPEWSRLWQNIKSQYDKNPAIITLTPQEQANLKDSLEALKGGMLSRQLVVEDQFKNSMVGLRNGKEYANLLYPSQVFQQAQAIHQYKPIIEQYNLSRFSLGIQVQAAEAISAGKNPQAVLQMAAELSQGEPK